MAKLTLEQITELAEHCGPDLERLATGWGLDPEAAIGMIRTLLPALCIDPHEPGGFVELVRVLADEKAAQNAAEET